MILRLASTVAVTILLAASAQAAERASAPSVSWTGLYVGIAAGQAWGVTHQYFDPGGEGPTYDVQGFAASGNIGYNWQAANWVVGVEADISSGLKGNAPEGSRGPQGGLICGAGPCEFEAKYFGTARGRLGVAFDRLLLYGTGGLAYGRVRAELVGSPSFYNKGTVDRTGWAGGIGAEYALTPKWSAKVEYLRVDLGSFKVGINGALNDYKTAARFNVVRVGLNYKFTGF